ncbi:MAG: hypothetical protein MUF54_16835 [Polyangiaceae bacterium]|nr:hypothetical protein [Polyangiaceae bacterium]
MRLWPSGGSLKPAKALELQAAPELTGERQVDEKMQLDGSSLRKRGIEVVFWVTSLLPERASGQRVLQLNREHWGIENKVHWVRDVTFDEDRSQVRKKAAHLMATLRRVRLGGETNRRGRRERRFFNEPLSRPTTSNRQHGNSNANTGVVIGSLNARCTALPEAR